MATKLLLVKDTEGLGRSGKVVSVRPGYARNFLLPQGFAVAADKRALRMQARLQEESQQRAVADREESEAIALKLQAAELTKIVKVDHEGHMYGSVTAHDIATLLQEQTNVAVEKRMIALKHPIKQTGQHKIELRLKEGVETSVLINIMPEEGQNPVEKVQKAE